MIADTLRRLRRSAIARNESGAVLIEFALGLPVVLTLGFGGIETANLGLAHLRVSQIALTVADNAGRVNTRIDEADIQEVFTGAEIVGEAIDFQENGRVVLSSLQHNGLEDDEEGQMINWQRCYGDLDVDPAYGVQNDGRTDGELQAMGEEGQQIAAIEGTAIMFVEVSYEYEPIVPLVLDNQVIRYESAFVVRGRTEHDITNAGSLPVSNCT